MSKQIFSSERFANAAYVAWTMKGPYTKVREEDGGWVVVYMPDSDEFREYLSPADAYHLSQELYAAREAQEAFLNRVPDDWRVLVISNTRGRVRRYYGAGSGEQEAFTKLAEVRRKCERTVPAPTIVLQEYNHKRAVWENR